MFIDPIEFDQVRRNPALAAVGSGLYGRVNASTFLLH